MPRVRNLATLLIAVVLTTIPLAAFAQPAERSADRGFVFIQIDGLSEPALVRALDVGHMPFVSSLLAAGSHTLGRWEALAPSTTPASQSGILHGSNADVPGFRWWDRDLGRFVELYKPRDALLIERNVAGSGDLMSSGDASISNMFSGGATRMFLTVSRLDLGLRNLDVLPYLFNPVIMAREIVGVAKVLWEVSLRVLRERSPLLAAWVERLAPVPDIDTAVASSIPDVLTQVILGEMRRGTRIIYADLAIYDSIVHDFGLEHELPAEALRRADAVARAVAASAGSSPRDYRLIILSDHGQTAGASFKSRYGMDFEELVSGLMSEPAQADGDSDRASETPAVDVSPSGNLANISFPTHDHRLSAEEIERLHPGLLAGLAAHPAMGFMVVRSERAGLIAIGPGGTHYLDEGRIEGVDPLAPFGPYAAANLRRLGSFRNVGDILVNSVYDPVANEVVPFEPQVSSHGGLGGPQTKAFIVYPTGLEPGEAPLMLVGAESVNVKLREWVAQAPQDIDRAEVE